MANNQQISPLQLTKTRSFTGLSESNHLANAFLTEPHKMGMILAYDFGYRYNNILNQLTAGLGNIKMVEVGNREYNWDLHSQNERAIEVIGNLGDGGGTPGIGGSEFRVRFAEKWFTATDELVSDDFTHVRVQTEPYQDGNSWVYSLRMVENDSIKFIDITQITSGAKFSKLYSTVEEFSNRGGGTHTQTPFKLQNCLTTLRKQYEITGSAASDIMVIELPDPMNPGKKTKMWMRYLEWNAMQQFYAEIQKSMVYSLYNKATNQTVTLPGENGRPVFTGAGLRQQIAPANRRFYNQLTYTILQEFLMDLSYSATSWGGNTKFLALTGKYGMIEFDNAMREKYKDLGITVLDKGTFIDGRGQDLTLQGQFKTVKFPNGIELTVTTFDPYDDIVQNRTLHPRTKRPIESYRFTVMGIGSNGESNFRKVVKQDRDMVMWYEGGSIDSVGKHSKSISTLGSTSKDGAVIHMLSECGGMLADPTSCGELILSLD